MKCTSSLPERLRNYRNLLTTRLTIRLYPFGSRRGSKRRLEKYRKAWELLGVCSGLRARGCEDCIELASESQPSFARPVRVKDPDPHKITTAVFIFQRRFW